MYALASFIALWFQACVRAYAGNSAQVDRKGIAVSSPARAHTYTGNYHVWHLDRMVF